MSTETKRMGGFRPGGMQWVIVVLLLMGLALPIFTPILGEDGVTFSEALQNGLTVARIGGILVVLAAWAYWVWRQPLGGQGLAVPLLAIGTAFLFGAILIVLVAGQDLALRERFDLALRGYAALVEGSFLEDRALSNTLVVATPLIFTGLAVALAFRSGLFNIGAEGQFMIGALCSVLVSYMIELPLVLHALVALIAGALGGALWGAIPGILKARLGAHEVINTIMMNYIAIAFVEWLVNGPIRDTKNASTFRTPLIHGTAHLPQLGELFPEQFARNPLHLGFFLALLCAVGIWWLLWKTTIGFELRTTGSNPDAARYAGIRAGGTIVLAMALSGALAGLAGAVEVQALSRSLPSGFSTGYGFTAIAVALLAFNQPLAIIPSGILFGALKTGSEELQSQTGISKHMIAIIQALILLFVAAPALIRWLYRLGAKKETMEDAPLTPGLGG